MDNKILEVVIVLVPMLLSLSVHEYAHALAAKKLGDTTATEMGRLTLNPVSHIDIFGTLLLPIFAVMSGINFLFGWAKPVPINPLRFDRTVTMRAGMAITAAAGPISNVILAVLSVAILKALVVTGKISEINPVFVYIIQVMISLNVVLAIFNMLPLPPLDGSRIVTWLLPPDKVHAYNSIQAYSFIILIGFLFFFGKYMGAVVSFFVGALYMLFGLR